MFGPGKSNTRERPVRNLYRRRAGGSPVQGAREKPPSAARTRRVLACPILRSQNPFGLSVEWLRFFSMNSNGESKPEPVDPEMLVRMLEIEMIQKRAARQQA